MYWDELACKLRNWGRWGDADELGTLNYITEAKVREAVACVRHGRIVSLTIPFDANGPCIGHVGRFNPVHYMTADGGDDATQGGPRGEFRHTDDHIVMPLQAGTQWDALAHVYYGGKLYNGFPSTSVTSSGAQYGSIDKMTTGIVSRGVLLDIARLRDKRWLERGETITASDLASAAEAHHLAVRPGDIVLVRTGWWQKYATERDGRAWWDGEPGIDHTTLEWFHQNQIAAVASDNWGVEVGIEPASDRSRPVHLIALRDMGMPLGEIWDLEGLSAACTELGQYDFLLTAPPLRITAAVGSPVNPLAIL